MEHAAVSKASDKKASTASANKRLSSANNSAIKTFIQPKLKVGSANDSYEREADSVASSVLKYSTTHEKPNRQSSSIAKQMLQRKCDSCREDELQRKPLLHNAISLIQRKATDTRKNLNLSYVNQVTQNPGAGAAVPKNVRKYVEPVLGADVSSVRVHSDHSAKQAASDINAKAFTYKNNIYLGRGQSPNDLGLMAHELTHTVQQGAVNQVNRKEISVSNSSETPNIQKFEFEVPSLDDVIDAGSDLAGSAYDTAAGAVADISDWGVDQFWSFIESIAPAAFVSFLREVSDVGIFEYLKQRISDSLEYIFDEFPNVGGVLRSTLELFGSMYESAGEILQALASGDCEPLFAVLSSFKETVMQMAGDAWQAISDFFAPVGEFFTDLWSNYGAPVMDWLSEMGGEIGAFISGLGEQITEWFRPIQAEGERIINWVKDQLGISDDSSGGGGFSSWISNKAQEAWNTIKEFISPVTEPLVQLKDKIVEILPMDAILNLRETVNDWLQNITQTASALDENEGGDVAERQVSLREQLLPAILTSIQNFRIQLVTAGLWVADKIGAAVTYGDNFINTVVTTPLLSGLSGSLQWLRESLTSLSDWTQNKVISLFTLIGNGLDYLAGFITPIYDLLMQVVTVVSDLLGNFTDLIVGRLWNIIPECIREPLKTFFIEQILGRIPLFGQLTRVTELWSNLQATAIEILARIFIDGDLFGALWLFFRTMLGIIGLPAQLVVQVIANSAAAFSDILMNPIGFIINLLRAAKEGFTNFFGNIIPHLFSGVSDWLFDQVSEAGIEPPVDFSFSEILRFVLEVLGLTVSNILQRIGDRVGMPDLEDRFNAMRDRATEAWGWIRDLLAGNFEGLWQKISERISDLWGAVLDGVVGWINTRIIERATRWLLGLLDVTGIMPVINAIIAVYNAIQSFVQQMRAMLEIINTMMLGILDIARGSIVTAATYLENALADGIPVVISFLANQFGFNSLGTRLRELIGSLQERVNQALDWVIDLTIRAGQAFIDMLRRGRDAIVNWWNARKEFRTNDGEEHSLYFNGSGDSAELYLASNPQSYRQFINAQPNSADKNHALEKVDQLEAAIERARNPQTTNGVQESESADNSNNESVRSILDQLSIYTTSLLNANPSASGEEELLADTAKSIPQLNSRLNAASRTHTSSSLSLANNSGSDTVGMQMTSHYITYDTTTGSSPRGQRNLYGEGKLPTSGTYGGSDYTTDTVYIKGHLLNHNPSRGLGGEGVAENLFPITGQANSAHERNVERHVKSLVHDEKKVAYYEVSVRITQGPAFIVNQNCGYQFVDSVINCRWGTYRLSPDGTITRNEPHAEPIRSVFNKSAFQTKMIALKPDCS